MRGSTLSPVARPASPRRRTSPFPFGFARLTLILALAWAGAGCASAGRLAEYDFQDRTLAAVTTAPPRPTIETPDATLAPPGEGGLLGAVIRAGAELARDYEAWKAGPKLDRAATLADVSGRMSAGVLDRSAAVLRAEPVAGVRDADFEMVVHVTDYGIDFSDWDGAARWFIRAEVTLNDADGRRIWRADVDERDDVRGGVQGGAVGDILTARALAKMSEEEMAGALRGLADYSAERIARKLRDGLAKARAN
jgi:hypothetical protein